MDTGQIIIVTIISGFVGMYIGTAIHELTHYAVCRMRGASATIVTDRLYLPHKTIFERPGELSYSTIRLAAGLVVIYPVSALLLLILLGIPDIGGESLLFFILCGASVVSPADWLGVLYPERWQEYAVDYSGEGHRETLQILITEIRK